MPEFVDVVVETGNQGVAPTAEVSSRDGGKPTLVSSSRAAKAADAPGVLAFAKDTHSATGSGRELKDSTREKISAIMAAHAAAQPAEDVDAEESAVEVEDATVEPSDVEDDDEVIDGAATPSPEPAKAKAAPPSDVEERLKELEGVTERQRAALERYEAQLAEARKAGEETAAQRAARLDAAESEYLADPIKAIHKYVATALGHDDENHDDVKKEVMDLFLDLTSHVGGVTQDPGHLAKRQSDRTRREWEREKKGRAASGKKEAETAAQREREQSVEGIIGEVDKTFATAAEKYPHLTALAPLLEGKTPGRVIYELVESGIKRGEFKVDDKGRPVDPDEVLIERAAKAAEAYYTKRADPLRSALQPKSTAKPAATEKVAPAAQVEREKPRTSKEARVTNADASVAPATPPAKKPAPKAIPLQNDEARRKHALRHLKQKR